VNVAPRYVFGLALGVLALLVAGDAAIGPHGFAVSGPPPPVAGAPVVTDPDVPSAEPSPTASPSATPSASPRPSATRTARPSPTRTSVPAAAKVDNLASRLRTLPAATSQVVIAYASGFSSTTGTLETYQKVGGVWQPALRAMPMYLGTRGFRDAKTEGDLSTPTGVYRIGATMYGIAGNPGVRYAYHQLVADDYWDENSASPGYNGFVHGTDPGGGSEKLWSTTPQYTYFAVIDYNIPVVAATPARGSGIFLHVSAGRATAGCLALAQADLVAVLRWLNPAASPRIVMAPGPVLSRY
jgi:L,D-peptidoglycan transpeptidase YkuD (ErfK/YbiS/YcfS/YnhG family)